MIHLALFLALIAYTIHETDGQFSKFELSANTHSKIYVVGDGPCSTVCANYSPQYICDLTLQANMTREECGLLWKTTARGYDLQKHKRNSNSGTVWPFAADSGSQAGAGAPCVLEKETGRLLYLSNNDYRCDSISTDKYYSLCFCDIDPEYNSPKYNSPCFMDFDCVGDLICQGYICQPDCNTFKICSNEFAGTGSDIGTLETDVDTLDAIVTTIADEISSIQTSITAINTNIGSNDIDIDAIKDRLDVNEQHISSLLTRVTEAETDIDDLEPAHVTTRVNDLETSLNEGGDVEGRLDIIEANIVNLISRVGVVETSLNEGGIIDTRLDALEKRRKKKSKDMLLIFLLILNTLLIVSCAISCVLWNKSRGKYHQYNNTKLYSSDDENR